MTFDFTKGLPDGWTAQSGDLISYGSNGAAFTINAQKQAPTIVLNKYVFYGKLEVVLQAAPGAGICTAVVLLSDDLGEIDWVRGLGSLFCAGGVQPRVATCSRRLAASLDSPCRATGVTLQNDSDCRPPHKNIRALSY